jgi:hypothetical protein
LTDNLAPALGDLAALRKEAFELSERARAILDDLRPALVGRRVFRWGRVYQIDALRIDNGARVRCYGVTVSGAGKVGTRGFDLGTLDECEIIS